jgi:hypothetical protein
MTTSIPAPRPADDDPEGDQAPGLADRMDMDPDGIVWDDDDEDIVTT